MPSLRSFLAEDDKGKQLLERLAGIAPDPAAYPIPDEAELRDRLIYVGAPEADIDALIATRPLIAGDPDLVELTAQLVELLRQTQGDPSVFIYFPELPEAFGALQRQYWLYVYLTALPVALEYHRRRGIPEEQSRAILEDIGRNVKVARKRYGAIGIAAPWWCSLHIRGMIYQLGRLQFERIVLGETIGKAMQDAGLDVGPGSPCLSLHIPDFMGGFPPAAIDDSIARAHAFFKRYFPDQPTNLGVCFSWLLDERLPAYLPAGSNIVAFNRRFTITSQGERDNSAASTFIWGTESPPAPRPDQPTSLEQGIFRLIDQGGAWGSGSGWTRLA
jgi:hypothetical protein